MGIFNIDKYIDASWLINMNIDINKYASDIIFVKRELVNTFKNNSTGKSSNNLYDVVREGKRFIIMDFLSHDKRGYMLINDERHGVLVIIAAEVRSGFDGVFKWHITDRACISKTGEKCGLSGNKGTNFIDFFPETDIGGQAVVEDKYQHVETFYNHSVFSSREALDYFGGIRYTRIKFKHDSDDKVFMHFSSAEDIKKVLRLYKLKMPFVERLGFLADEAMLQKTVEKRIINLNLKDKALLDIDIPIPEEGLKAMSDYTQYYLNDVFEEIMNGKEKLSEKACDLTIMHEYHGYALVRSFVPHIKVVAPFSKSTFEFIETERVWYTKNMLKGNTSAYNIKHRYVAMPDAVNFIIWRGDMKGTVMEYCTFITDEFLKELKDRMYADDIEFHLNDYRKNMICGPRLNYAFHKASDSIDKKYGILAKNIIRASALMGNHHVLEKLVKKTLNMYNAEKDPDTKEKIAVNMQSIFEFFPKSYDEILEKRLYGEIDMQQEELHKALMIPKPMLDMMIKKYRITSMNHIKTVFGSSEENKEYLMHMNMDMCEKLTELLFPADKGGSLNHRCASALESLINCRGVENTPAYIDFLSRLPEKDTDAYAIYAKGLEKTDDKMLKTAAWNISGKDLYDMASSIETLNWINSYDSKGVTRKKFKRLSRRWKKYNYSDGEYVVTYPQEPQELVIEGIMLHHCSKLFIEPVARKLTTILFVRKADEPEKPMYTLEIRKGKVRQCHVFANKQPDFDAIFFIKKFCEEKKIKCDMDSFTNVLAQWD